MGYTRNSQNLRCHNWDYLDIDNLVEELEGLNKKAIKESCTAIIVVKCFDSSSV